MGESSIVRGVLRNASIVFLLTASLLLSSTTADTGRYFLASDTINGGGGTSSGGQYILAGTIAQPDAAHSASGQYEVLGGFWPGSPLCIVEFDDFARFAAQWLDTGCNATNNWCEGADLDQSGDVDGADLYLFVQQWLYYYPYNWPLR